MDVDCGCGDACGPVLEPPPAALVPSTEKPSWTRFTRRSHPKPRCAEGKEPTKLLGKHGLKTFLPRQGTRNQPWDLTLVSPEADLVCVGITHTDTRTHVHSHACTHPYPLHTYKCTHAHTLVPTHAHPYTNTHKCTLPHTHVHILLYLHAHPYIHTWTHTCTQLQSTHTHRCHACGHRNTHDQLPLPGYSEEEPSHYCSDSKNFFPPVSHPCSS